MTRDIKGPENCTPLDLFEIDHYGGMSVSGEYVKIKGFTAQEVGQIIDLALEAGSDRPSIELRNTKYDRYIRREAKYQAWRELAERLKA